MQPVVSYSRSSPNWLRHSAWIVAYAMRRAISRAFHARRGVTKVHQVGTATAHFDRQANRGSIRHPAYP
jgi:hypothetical protein